MFQHIMIITLLSITSYMQAMQVYGETKKLREDLVSNRASQRHSYSPELIPFLPSQSKELKKYVSLSCGMVHQDIKNCIAAKFVHIYLEKHGINKIKSDPLLVLKLLCRAQSNGILLLGNKTFEWKDIIVLEKEQQENLAQLCNPNSCYSACVGTSNTLTFRPLCSLKCCGCSDQGSDINLLKGMPDHIKKGLMINVADDTICLLYGFTIAPGALLSGPVLCCTQGFSLPTLAGLMIAGMVGVGSCVGQHIYQECYSKKYNVEQDVFQQ